MLQFSEIETRRAAAGIEQAALAAKAGMHAQTYSKLKGKTKRGPTEATLKRLTEALQVLEQEAAAS